jgi:hypothetical protein
VLAPPEAVAADKESSRPSMPADTSSPTLPGDKIPMEAAMVVDKVFGNVVDALPFMEDPIPEKQPMATAPTPSKKWTCPTWLTNYPRLKCQRLIFHPRPWNKLPRWPSRPHKHWCNVQLFVVKEGYEFAVRAKNSLNTTIVEEMVVTCEDVAKQDTAIQHKKRETPAKLHPSATITQVHFRYLVVLPWNHRTSRVNFCNPTVARVNFICCQQRFGLGFGSRGSVPGHGMNSYCTFLGR